MPSPLTPPKLILFAALVGCAADDVGSGQTADTSDGTGDGDGDSTGDGDGDDPTGDGDGEGTSNSVTRLEIAQTHVLDHGLATWQLGDTEHELHVVGGRSLLALVSLAEVPSTAAVEAWVDGVMLGSVALEPASALAPTEADGPAYADDLMSAELEAGWVRPGLSLQVVADGSPASAPIPLPVGVDSDFDMWTLPFYLFGATPDNSVTLEEAGKPSAAAQAELYAKWPIARVNFEQHPAGRVEWPYIILAPRGDGPALRVTAKEQQPDGFAVMGAVLGTLGALRRANGEGGTNNQYYASLLMHNGEGVYESAGGGLGGGHVGTGTPDFAGIFIHEQGHAFGMPHAGGAYDNGDYPYVDGSLAGSVWGYDAGRHEFLAPFMPATADHAGDCLTDGAHQIDAEGRCVKQDPMQSGSGDQAEGYIYTMFSDFNASVMQRYFEGQTTLADGGEHQYSGGRVFVDPNSSTGYSRWDSIDGARVEVPVETTDNGLYGFDGGLPMVRDVPVHAIVFTISLAGDPELTQIYPPLSFVGNLVRQVDPTSAREREAIIPNTSATPWYCHASGCDYTLRVTYANDEVRQVLVQGGFRSWFGPMDPPPAASLDPLDGASYGLFAVNVPGEQPISKIELLDTPMGWNEPPANPTVLSTWE